MIREGSHDDIGAEKLRGLLKILPELDECEMLKAFSGDVNKLGNAEKFLMQLLQLPKWVEDTQGRVTESVDSLRAVSLKLLSYDRGLEVS